MPTGTCRYCDGPLCLDHTEATCRDEIDRRVAALLAQGVCAVDDIMYRLDEEGVYDELSEYVVRSSVNRVEAKEKQVR